MAYRELIENLLMTLRSPLRMSVNAKPKESFFYFDHFHDHVYIPLLALNPRYYVEER